MDTEEMLDATDSFIAGFGTRETRDCQNAVFIAMKLFNLDFPFEYKGMGRATDAEGKENGHDIGVAFKNGTGTITILLREADICTYRRVGRSDL